MLSTAALVAALVTTPIGGTPPTRWTAPLPQPLHVIRAFDPPAVRWGSGHRGVDLATAAGTQVVAAGPGLISFAGVLAGRGVVVVVHGELRSTYEPVVASVRVGALVRAGEVIGVLRPGHAPANPTAGVLHWGLLRGETYLDPMSLLSTPRPVRLLPRWQSAVGTPLDTGPPTASSATVATREHRPSPSPAPQRRPGLPAGRTVLAFGIAAVAATTAHRRGFQRVVGGSDSV